MGVFIFNVCSLAFPRDFSILDWQDACALFEQFCKPAGGGVSNHLGNLSHGEIGAYSLISLGGTASYLVFFADPDGWGKTMLGNGTEQSYIDTMRANGTTWILIIMLAGTILAAAISAFAGCKMLKKQFEKAGITK